MMDAPTTLLGWMGVIALGVPAFLFVITFIVFVHEMGHFLAARWCSVRIDSFSIGFGRELFGRTDKHGTRWKVSALPFGGFVKFWGDDGVSSQPDHAILDHAAAAERARSFHFKPLPQKALIAVAGPVANFILAFVVFTLMFFIYGAKEAPSRIGVVVAGTPAERAGLKPDDLITSIDGTPVESFMDMARIVSLGQGQPLVLKVVRAGAQIELTVTPALVSKDDNFGGKVLDTGIGVGAAKITADNPWITREFGLVDSAINSVSQIRFIVAKTFSFLGQLLTGSGDYRQLSGPAGIAAISAQVAVVGGMAGLILLVGVLSVSIGLLNLFPIPMLDGGHLLYYGIEAVRGRPLGERAQELGFRIGLLLVVGLMLIATWSDLVKFQIF